MGSLRKFDLEKLSGRFQAPYFCETGTWKGDGVALASKAGFKEIYSIEIFEQFALAARERFRDDHRVHIIHADSLTGLRKIIAEMNGNCIFWLDAHYPAADEGIRDYNAESDEVIRLPLEKELEIVASRLHLYQDVILIDDLRIYEEGPYRHGNIPDNIVPPKVRNIDFVYRLFGKTHIVLRSYQDEGYLCLLPKDKYHQGLWQRLHRFILEKMNRRVF